jgi:hypothetical protein
MGSPGEEGLHPRQGTSNIPNPQSCARPSRACFTFTPERVVGIIPSPAPCSPWGPQDSSS